MPYESKDLGAAGHVLRYRLRYHQRLHGKSLTALARRVKELGYPMTAARIGEAFNGYRRISTDELTALATAIGIPAGGLVLAESPSNNAPLVEQITETPTHDLRVSLAQAEFSIADLESSLEQGALLSKRERRDQGVLDPEETLSKLESVCIEIELIESELNRRTSRADLDGKH